MCRCSERIPASLAATTHKCSCGDPPLLDTDEVGGFEYDVCTSLLDRML